jgi:hypothetical protein
VVIGRINCHTADLKSLHQFVAGRIVSSLASTAFPHQAIHPCLIVSSHPPRRSIRVIRGIRGLQFVVF